jgi:beta-barrel assembly-enhancing protease
LNRRYFTPAIIILAMAISAVLVYRTTVENRVGLSAPMELWADVLRDVTAVTKKPVEQEQRLGERLAQSVPVETPQDASLQPYVDRVGARLTKQTKRKEINYRFTVREDAVVNAFALSGGYIYINTGLLSLLQSEDELAIVLGHEISHIELRHTAPGVIRSVLSLGYTKYQEFDADESGVRLARSAGYDASAAVTVLQKLAAQEPNRLAKTRKATPVGETGEVLMDTLGTYWRSHPETAERIRRVSHTIGRSNR